MSQKCRARQMTVALGSVWFGVTCGLVAGCDARGTGQQSQVVARMTTTELSRLMESEGYAVSVDEDGDVLWKIEGLRTYLLIGPDQTSLQFRAAFGDTEPTLEDINAWNESKRFSRSYLDEEGDPVLVLDLDLEGGVTEPRIVDFLKTARTSFAVWIDEVIQ